MFPIALNLNFEFPHCLFPHGYRIQRTEYPSLLEFVSSHLKLRRLIRRLIATFTIKILKQV